MLNHDYLVAKIGVDTAENELFEILVRSARTGEEVYTASHSRAVAQPAFGWDDAPCNSHSDPYKTPGNLSRDYKSKYFVVYKLV